MTSGVNGGEECLVDPPAKRDMLSEKTGVGASWWNGLVERSISDRTAGQNDRTERFLSSEGCWEIYQI